MPQLLSLLLLLSLTACTTLIDQETTQDQSLEQNTLTSLQQTHQNKDQAQTAQNKDSSVTKKSITKQAKQPTKTTAKKESIEQRLDKIDRQAGLPDTTENPKPETVFFDTSDFVFSPLFDEVSPPPVEPLMLNQANSKKFEVTQLLPQSNNPKDFSSYGFFTPTDIEEEKVNEEAKELREKVHIAAQTDLLNRIRNNFKLDLSLDNKRIQSQLNWYVRNPSYLNRTIKRSSRYLYHVVNEIQKHNLPMELALLPFVESAYDPFAYSHGRASGLWQFIPGTGKIYGLHQNWWYDGRRDVLASTQAAIDYLSYLSKRFKGDWLHALAAYNSGSGRVSGAIKKNKRKGKKTDFWSLKLPKETRAYVPKLLALSKIVQNPEKYGVTLPSVKDEPYFSVIQTGGQIDLAQAAALAEIEINELYKLNPGFNQWASAPLGPHRLLVPAANADTFKLRLKDLPPEKRLNWTRYSVQKGDSLIKIAKKFNSTPQLIKDVNHLRSNMIRQKQKLLIPVASRGKSYYDLSQTNRLETKQRGYKGQKGSTKILYTVKNGDTLWDLSREHKVGVRTLAKWNGIAPTDPIKPGQEILIWSKKNTEQLAKAPKYNIREKRNLIKKIGYRVRKGDSLARIANKFSVKINDLVNWNKLNKKKYLQPGQKLTIYVDITNS